MVALLGGAELGVVVYRTTYVSAGSYPIALGALRSTGTGLVFH
jgi:hypothetical protein